MDETIWPPPPANQEPTCVEATNKCHYHKLWLFVPGLFLGLLDISQTGSTVDTLIGYAAFILGLLQPKVAWLHAVLLSIGLFTVHVIAILCGLRHPYVENNVMSSISCFESLIPAFVFAYLGAGSRFLYNSFAAKTQVKTKP